MLEDYKNLHTLLTSGDSWTSDATTSLLQTLSHFANGSSFQFGTRSAEEEKQERKSWNRSWDLSLGAVVDFADSLTPKNKQKRDPLTDVNLEELPPENESPKTKNIEPKTQSRICDGT